MKKIKVTLLCSILFCVNTISFAKTVFEDDKVIVKYKDAKPYYEDDNRGWFFYEEPEIITKEEEEEEEEKTPVIAIVEPPVAEKPEPVLTPSERLREQGKAYEDAVALAVLEPSPENYRNYMVYAQQLLEQADVFATGVENYVYTEPSFDARLNISQGADVKFQNQVSKQQKLAKLNQLSQDNAILFFYRSDCPYCHKYAPIIKEFAKNTGFMIVPMALDSKPLLPEYPQFRVDNNLAQKLEVSAVPALYLLNPKRNDVTTVGFGLSDYNTLIDKVIASSERSFAKAQLNGSVAP